MRNVARIASVACVILASASATLAASQAYAVERFGYLECGSRITVFVDRLGVALASLAGAAMVAGLVAVVARTDRKISIGVGFGLAGIAIALFLRGYQV